MKICVLVKEVPDAAVQKRIDPSTMRLDRSGEKNLNPFDTHAIEAAMQIKEGGAIPVEEVVAVTMGPESAVRALHKAVALGADRSVHLTDDALAGSDVCATGYALAKVLESESPDLVLLGQQSDDGECYTIGAVVADHLQMPSLTQVIKIDVTDGKLRCERQAEYGYDTVEVELPAVISVGDAINEPRYPSLKAIMGAKKKPLDAKATGDVGIEADRVGEAGSKTTGPRAQPAARQGGGRDHRGRGHQRDGRKDRRLARREEADLDGRHPGLRPPRRRGQLQQKLARGDLRGGQAGRRDRRRGRRAGRRRRRRRRRAALGNWGAAKVYRAKNVPEGLAQPIVDAMAKVIQDNGISYALFGGGLLGFEIGAGLTARLNAGVTMEVTEVKVQDGKLVAERPILQDSQIADVGYVGEPGIIIGRLNAFDANESGGTAEVVDVDVELSAWSTKAKMVQRGEQRGADVNIEDADILVGGGRGLGAAEGFKLCEELAEAMGGAVAATRAVVDAGWYPYAAQIGQTGKTVAPKLYLAAGISGAIQHKVGMQNSENILAINKDPNAPIFEFSDLGVVGDLHKIVPKLTEAIKAKKGG